MLVSAVIESVQNRLNIVCAMLKTQQWNQLQASKL
jgi:hypothetical protein